jgi:hypothetical protein
MQEVVGSTPSSSTEKDWVFETQSFFLRREVATW